MPLYHLSTVVETDNDVTEQDIRDMLFQANRGLGVFIEYDEGLCTLEKQEEPEVHSTLEEIREALETLSRAIGVYGERYDNPVTLTWGNGLVMKEHNYFCASGRIKVAEEIFKLKTNIKEEEL